MKEKVLAVDLGASSGRVIAVSLDDEKLLLKEIHRFVNKPIFKRGILSWDIDYLFEEISEGIRKAITEGGVISLGIDTWGVDFGLVNEFGDLISPPAHYRDSRTKGMVGKVAPMTSLLALYQQTGNQIMEINTLFQLLVLKEENPEDFYQAKKMLLMPDLFNYLLTGQISTEASIASTTQLTNPYTKNWSSQILNNFDLPEWLFPTIVQEGNVLGKVKPELGLGEISVINVCQHDTASAVISVPAEGEFLFISCGTWSLIGTELKEPIINEQAQKFNLTNESGHNRTTRLLKNCTGLWILQELKRNYAEESEVYSFDDITALVETTTDIKCVIDTDDALFAEPGDMRERIREYAKRTQQSVPQKTGEFFRCTYVSLAYKYAETIKEIEETVGRRYSEIHIIGGGSQASFLCQLVANITNKEVIAGPIEATAIGNGIVQLIAAQKIASIEAARKLVSHSFDVLRYQPIQ